MITFFSETTINIIITAAITGFGTAIGSFFGAYFVNRLIKKDLESIKNLIKGQPKYEEKTSNEPVTKL